MAIITQITTKRRPGAAAGDSAGRCFLSRPVWMRRPVLSAAVVYCFIVAVAMLFVFDTDALLQGDLYGTAAGSSRITAYARVLSVSQRGDGVYRLICEVKGVSASPEGTFMRAERNNRVLVSFGGELEDVLFPPEEGSSAEADRGRTGFYGSGDSARARGILDNYGAAAGRTVVIEGELSLAARHRNPHTFDYARHLISKGIGAVMTADSLSFPKELVMPDGTRLGERASGGVVRAASRLRCALIEEMRASLSPRSAELAVGMLLGDKNVIDDETYEMYQRNGTAHILAVSGIHVGLIYAFLLALMGGRKSLPFQLTTLSMLVFYACVADFAPSVVRAVAMIAMHILAKLTNRRYDLVSAAAFTAAVSLMIRPAFIMNTGFILSYAAIFTVAFVMPAFRRALGESRLAEIFAPALAIQAGMAPLTAFYFNYFSLTAFFINIPVIYLAGLIIPIALVFSAAAGIGEAFGAVIGSWESSAGVTAAGVLPEAFSAVSAAAEGIAANMLDYSCRAMDALNVFAFADGRMYRSVASPPVLALVFFYGAFFYFCSETGLIHILRKQYAKITAAVLIITVAAFSVAAAAREPYDGASAVFVDVGQGDCLHIRTPGGKNILVDGGGSVYYDVGGNTLAPYLLKNGVSGIDLALVTHLHTDHYKGICELARVMPVGTLAVYEANRLTEDEIVSDTGISADNIAYLKAGDTVSADGVTIEILAPGARPDICTAEELRETDENGISLIMKISVGGMSILMTGDLGAEGEEELVETYERGGRLKCDVLKAAHHGSAYSTCDAFLDAVSPETVVIQVGKNNYGHPSPNVIEKCARKGIIVYRNDTQGAVCFTRLKDGVWRADTVLR